MNRPRFLGLGPGGKLIIGSLGADIYRIKKPHTTPEILVSLPGLNHSVVYRDGQLFVVETDGLNTASYYDPGIYDVSLQVTDPRAMTDTETKSLHKSVT